MAYINLTAADLDRMTDIEAISLLSELRDLYKGSKYSRNQEVAIVLYQTLLAMCSVHNKIKDRYDRESEDRAWLKGWDKLSPTIQAETSIQAQIVNHRTFTLDEDIDQVALLPFFEMGLKEMNL